MAPSPCDRGKPTESLRQPGRPGQSLDQHGVIAEAVRAKDPEAAAHAMHTHVESVGHVKLLEWQANSDEE